MPPSPRISPDQLTAAALDTAFAEAEQLAAERGLAAAAFTDALPDRAVARLGADHAPDRLRAAAQAAVAARADALLGRPQPTHAGRTWWMSAHAVDAIWTVLRDGAANGKSGEALAPFTERFGAAGHAPGYAVDDLLHDLGLGAIASADALKAFEVETVTLFPRPGRHDEGSIGTTYVRLAEVAAQLIRMESFGLPVDPAPLVAPLRPALARRDHLLRAEIDVWWYERERHRIPPVTVAVDDRQRAPQREELTTASGYKVEAWLTADDREMQLGVTSPKHRREGGKSPPAAPLPQPRRSRRPSSSLTRSTGFQSSQAP